MPRPPGPKAGSPGEDAPLSGAAPAGDGSLPQEPVERRGDVGIVKPSDYPLADRRMSDATGVEGDTDPDRKAAPPH